MIHVGSFPLPLLPLCTLSSISLPFLLEVGPLLYCS